MFKCVCADKVSVSIYFNPWADGHSDDVGNLVKRQEQVGVSLWRWQCQLEFWNKTKRRRTPVN